MIDFYVDQTVQPRFEGLINKTDLELAIKPKMDFVLFNDYLRKQLAKESVNAKEMMTDERLFKIEQRLECGVSREDLNKGLKLKVNQEKYVELREMLGSLQANNENFSEK